MIIIVMLGPISLSDYLHSHSCLFHVSVMSFLFHHFVFMLAPKSVNNQPRYYTCIYVYIIIYIYIYIRIYTYVLVSEWPHATCKHYLSTLGANNILATMNFELFECAHTVMCPTVNIRYIKYLGSFRKYSYNNKCSSLMSLMRSIHLVITQY